MSARVHARAFVPASVFTEAAMYLFDKSVVSQLHLRETSPTLCVGRHERINDGRPTGVLVEVVTRVH